MSKLSVVVPAYNEEAVIADAVRSLHDFWSRDPSGREFEILVVDDGSSDRTAERVQALGLTTVQVHRQRNGGKGAAVGAGVARSTGDVVYFVDADLSCSLENQRDAVRLVDDGVRAVIGSRRHPEAETINYSPARRVFSLALKVLMQVLLGLRVGDTQCGLKSFDGRLARELFAVLEIPGFGFDLELLVVLQRNGITVHELPVRFQHTTRTSVSLIRDSLKILANIGTLKARAMRGHYDNRLTTVAPRSP